MGILMSELPADLYDALEKIRLATGANKTLAANEDENDLFHPSQGANDLLWVLDKWLFDDEQKPA